MHFINEIPQKTKNGNIKWLIKNSIHQNITFSGYSVIFFYTFINKTNCFVVFETLKKSFLVLKKSYQKIKKLQRYSVAKTSSYDKMHFSKYNYFKP